MKKLLLLFFIFTSLLYATKIDIDEFIKNNNTAMLIINPKDGQIVNANQYAANFYGVSLSSLKQKNIKEINAFTKEQVQAEMAKAREENRNYFIFNHKIANEEIAKVQVFSYPIIYKNQNLLFSLITRYDDKNVIENFNKNLEEQVKKQTSQLEESKKNITKFFLISSILLITWVGILIYLLKQRKDLAIKIQEKNKELHESNERFELAMDATKDGLWDWDIKNNKVVYSKTWKEMLGFKEDELEDRLETWESMVHEDDIKKAKEDLKDHLKGFTNHYENIHRMRHKDGHFIWILDRAKIVFDENKEPSRMIGFHTDITLQKEAEKKIQEQKEEFERIFSSANDAIAIVDLDTKFKNFNNAYLKLTGFTKAELLTKSCIDFVPKEDKDSVKDIIQEVMQKGTIENFERRYVVKDNKALLVSMNLALMPDKKRLIIAARDITEQKKSQSKEKLASMGEMIGNIAHQWRQPLSVITTNASGLRVQKDLGIMSDEALFKSLDSIMEQAEYLSHTIDDFRTYVKEDKKKEETTLIYILSKALSLNEARQKNNYVEVITNFESDFKITAFKNELIQAFLNIINNSLDAMKQNEIKRKLLIISTKKTKDEISLEIKDNAGGIEKSILPRIFEPYFTTKHQNVGTGIGLSLAYDILVNHHQAQIEALNEEFEFDGENYVGAKFIIRFKKA